MSLLIGPKPIHSIRDHRRGRKGFLRFYSNTGAFRGAGRREKRGQANEGAGTIIPGRCPMRKLALLLSLVLLAGRAFPEWLHMKDLKVAVLDVVSRVQGESIDTATLTEMLQVALVDRDEFRIVERSLLDKIVKEQEFEVSGITEGQAAKIGMLAGADKIMLVSLAKFADKYLVIVKGIDTKSGIVDLSDQVLSYSVGGFIDVFPVLADRLVRKARGESVAAYKIPADQGSASASPAPATVDQAGIGGSYAVKGTNPDGSSYAGSCEVALKPDGSYSFDWIVGGSAYVGVGNLENGVMTVDWGDSWPVVYRVQQGGRILVGTWSNGKAAERMSR